MGMFDDLIPAPAATAAGTPSASGMFDDLIPEAAATTAAPGLVGGVARSFTLGVPILGPAIRNANAAIDAAVAPYTDAYSDPSEQLPGQTFSERYTEARAKQDAQDAAFQAQHPIASTAAGIAGGVAGFIPAGETAIGAKLLGMTGGSLLGRTALSAATGSAIGGADAAVRGDDVSSGATVGAGTGFLGPVGGRLIGGAIEGARGLLSPSAAIPTADAIKSVAQSAYQKLQSAGNGIPVSPQSWDTLAQNATSNLNQSGLRSSIVPKVHATINDTLADPQIGDVSDLVAAKRAFKELSNGNDPSEAAAANKVLPMIDTQILKSSPQLFGTLREADQNYASAMLAQRVQDAIEQGKQNAAKSGVGGNVVNNIRQAIAPMVKVGNEAAGLSSDEVAQARQVVTGGSPMSVTNLARLGSRLDPTSHSLALMAQAAMAVPSGGLSVFPAFAGYGASRLAEARTVASANQLADMIRARAPASVPAVAARSAASVASQMRQLQLEKIANAGVRSATPVFGSLYPGGQ